MGVARAPVCLRTHARTHGCLWWCSKQSERGEEVKGVLVRVAEACQSANGNRQAAARLRNGLDASLRVYARLYLCCTLQNTLRLLHCTARCTCCAAAVCCGVQRCTHHHPYLPARHHNRQRPALVARVRDLADICFRYRHRAVQHPALHCQPSGRGTGVITRNAMQWTQGRQQNQIVRTAGVGSYAACSTQHAASCLKARARRTAPHRSTTTTGSRESETEPRWLCVLKRRAQAAYAPTSLAAAAAFTETPVV